MTVGRTVPYKLLQTSVETYGTNAPLLLPTMPVDRQFLVFTTVRRTSRFLSGDAVSYLTEFTVIVMTTLYSQKQLIFYTLTSP